MLVNNDNIISYNENKRERNNEVKTKLIDDSERESDNKDSNKEINIVVVILKIWFI